MSDLAEMQAMAVLRETETEIQKWGTDYSCSRQLQRERGSKALDPSQVHENRNRNGNDYMREKETVLLRNDQEACAAAGSNLAAFRLS